MWTSIRYSRAIPGGRSHLAVAVAVLACVGLTACTATEQPAPASTAEVDTVAPFPESGDIDPGTYLVTGYPVPFEITVPDGWETGDGEALTKEQMFLTFWPAPYVPTDACAWRGALVQIDPTAEAFVDAMAAQKSTVSTHAVEVMVGDYAGFEFDLSAESGVDMDDCDSGYLCVHAESGDGCSRGHTEDGERETYRVVDLNGERAVIAVGQVGEPVDPALIEEARAVFDSIEFVRPGTETATVLGVDPNIEISYTLPDGWAKIDQSWVKSPYAHVGFGSVGNVFVDGCQWTLQDPPLGPNVDDLAAAWGELPGFTATTPVDITVDGYAGKRVDFTLPDYEAAECREDTFLVSTGTPGTSLKLVRGNPLQGHYWARAPEAQNRQWILDVDGTRLVIHEESDPGTTPEQLADMDEFLASVQIG